MIRERDPCDQAHDGEHGEVDEQKNDRARDAIAPNGLSSRASINRSSMRSVVGLVPAHRHSA